VTADLSAAVCTDKPVIPIVERRVFACGTFGSPPSFNVVNVTDPAAPFLEGYVGLAWKPSWVHAMPGQFACLTSHLDDRFVVVDATDKTSPVVVSSLTSPQLDAPAGLDFVHPYAYVPAFTFDGLVIIDVSDPASPVQVGYVQDRTILNGARYVHKVGDYAYVAAAYADRLVVVDVSDPTAPTIVGSAGPDARLDDPMKVVVVDNYAYVTSWGSVRLTVVDVSNPANPVIVGSVYDARLDRPRFLDVEWPYAYVPTSGDRLTIVDVSDPTAPVVISSVHHPTRLDWAQEAAVYPGLACVTAYYANCVTTVDVSDPHTPGVISSVSAPPLGGPLGCCRAAP